MEILSVQSCRWHDATFQNRSKFVVDTGLVVFESTRLMGYGKISEADVSAIDKFFNAIHPDTNNTDLKGWDNHGGFVEHCYLSGEIAFKLTNEINNKIDNPINPYAQKAALKLHDLGRTAINSFMETDELTDIFWQQIGLRRDLKDMMHSAHLYWPKDDQLKFEDISVSKRISIVSDVFGKWSQIDPKRLRHKEEILEAVSKAKEKYLHKENPSLYEKELIWRLNSYTVKEQYAISRSLDWLKSLDIDINTIVDEVVGNYKEIKN